MGILCEITTISGFPKPTDDAGLTPSDQSSWEPTARRAADLEFKEGLKVFNVRQALSAALVSAFLMGCSTAPRSFSPVLADPSVAGPAFDTAVQECTQLVNAGVRSNFRNHPLTAGAAGAVAGYSAGAVVFYTGLAAGTITTAASASMVAMPLVGILVATAYAGNARTRRERAIQAALSRCLQEKGYLVSDWQLQRERRGLPDQSSDDVREQ